MTDQHFSGTFPTFVALFVSSYCCAWNASFGRNKCQHSFLSNIRGKVYLPCPSLINDVWARRVDAAISILVVQLFRLGESFICLRECLKFLSRSGDYDVEGLTESQPRHKVLLPTTAVIFVNFSRRLRGVRERRERDRRVSYSQAHIYDQNQYVVSFLRVPIRSGGKHASSCWAKRYCTHPTKKSN